LLRLLLPLLPLPRVAFAAMAACCADTRGPLAAA
jgi:hypothetical protein